MQSRLEKWFWFLLLALPVAGAAAWAIAEVTGLLGR
jgi:hypothetical protein